MASDDENPKKSSTGLWIGFFLCFTTSVAASSGITYYLTKAAKDANPSLTQQNNDKDALLASLRKQIAEHDIRLDAIKAESDVLKLYLRHSSSTALKNILINQEQNIQSYLAVMKSAMKDLSVIVPSAADWNKKYQYPLDIAQKRSIEREDLLKLLKTGEPNESSLN